MLSLRTLLIYEGDRAPAELVALLAAGSHLVQPASGLGEAADLLTIEQFDAVLLAPDYPAEAIEGFATALRKLDHDHRSSGRTVLLSCAPTPPECSSVDLHLSAPDDFTELAAIVAELSSFRVLASGAPPEPEIDLPVFEPEGFEDQCAHDADLMTEILDLFGAECDQELPGIAASLAAGDFERASRLAHSFKGSLGSLHAARARRHAQDLEMAAREADAPACSKSLHSLRDEIATLRAHLLEFRQASLS